MYAYISGKLTHKSPTLVVLENHGIGYELHISLHTYSSIQSATDCLLHTYLHVKEDGHTLYGFAEPQEKALFIQLIGVSGIGPNTARMILSSLAPGELVAAIRTENEVAITRIKGVGPKSAKRLILELKDKLGKTAIADTLPLQAGNSAREEALSALVMLGFARPAAEKALVKAIQTTPDANSVEALVKISLKNL
jgi:Holliday junction DNA helicase RuvA